MISFQEAMKILQSQKCTIPTEKVPLHEAYGRFLAEPVRSIIDSPPFHKAAMDGFAVLKHDESKEFVIQETIAAGERPKRPLQLGSCTKIMTGAMLPDNAGKVIRVEYTREDQKVMKLIQPEPYENIIFRGENLKKGEEFIPLKRIAAKELGSLAASGITEVSVFQKIQIGLIATGSELRPTGTTLEPGEIYDSNSHQLSSQIRSTGATLKNYGVIADTKSMHYQCLQRALNECDIVILSGGVSKGEFDFVPETLESLGVDTLFHGVLVKPGRPTLFGRRDNNFVFGLPGNPVSTYILFEMMIKPFIFHLQGLEFHPPRIVGTLTKHMKRRDAERLEFRPVQIKISQYPSDPASNSPTLPVFELIHYKGPSHLNALVQAEALLIIPPGVKEISPGELVMVQLL